MALLQKAYLGSTPLFRNTSWFEDGAQLTIDESSEVTVTADTNAHTKGAWSQIIASTTANATMLKIIVRDIASNNVNTATLLDIGTGASGSETALISNIAVGGAPVDASNAPLGLAFSVPIKVASGTRLSARIQSVVTGGKTGTVTIATYDMGDYAFGNSSVDVMGTSTATSAGTAMSGSSGSWVQVTASTSNAYRAVVVVPNCSGTAGNNLFSSALTLGKGASGAEVELGKVEFSTTTGELVTISPFSSNGMIVPAALPSGTRLAVKHELAANASSYGVTLIGIR